MTNGAPRITNVDIDRQNHAQAAQIHALLTRHVPEQDVAAAVGCTLARVRAVAAQPKPDTSHHDDDDTDTGAVLAAPSMSGLTVSKLLAATTGHPDQRIARLAAHITTDLATLRAMYAEAAAAAQHAARLQHVEARLGALHADSAARHRRRSDGQAPA